MKVISSHTHAFFFFFLILQCFEERLLQILLIFQNSFFYNFDRSSLFFDQSKLCLKISVSLYLVRLIEPVFRSIEHDESSFFKTQCLTHSKHFFKTFSNFPLSLWLGKAPLRIFCRFQPNSLQGFSLPRPVRTLYPFFYFIFMISCIISCILMGFSKLFTFGIFVESILFFWNWSLRFAHI